MVLYCSGKMGVKDIEALIEVLKDKHRHYEERRVAAEGLGKISDERTVEPLILALNDGSEMVRGEVRKALIKIGTPALGPLTSALENEKKRIREEVALVIRDGEFRDESAVEPLIRALEDESSFVRSLSAQVLGQIGDPRAIEPLTNALKSSHDHSVAEALANMGSPALIHMIRFLEDEDWVVRELAVEALGMIGDSRAVNPLIPLMKDESEYVRWKTAEALGKIGDISVIELLSEALEVEDRDFVRKSIVEALGGMSGARAIASLIRGLGNVNRDVRELATKLLVNKGSEAVAFLVKALEDLDRNIRNGAAKALAKIGSPAIEPLIQALNTKSQRVRVESAWLLGEFGDERAVEPLIRVLEDDDEEFRIAASKALNKINKKANETKK